MSIDDFAFGRKFEVTSGGVPIMPQAEREQIDGLTMRHRTELWGAIRKHEAALLDLDLPFTCPNPKCRKKEKASFELQPSFFYPAT
mgnify:CR=1 FL=1